jgi:leader peptidase (prepilin peptidase) / N-methyltransferase
MDHLPPVFIGTAVFLFGLIFGSFINVVIYRLPKRESVVYPSSRCTACQAAIKPYDNIPVLSYLILRGKCRNCGAPISAIYPAVELLVGCLYLLLYFKELRTTPDGLSLRFLANCVFVTLIVPLVFIDLRWKILPDLITKPGIVIMLILRLVAPDSVINHWTRSVFGLTGWSEWGVTLASSVLGALAGGGSLWLVRELYYRLRRVEGMGWGDVKMMMMVGVFIGWQLSILTIFIASLLGSLVGLLVIWRGGGSMKMELPFGVFLGPAAVIALFIGHELITWYLGLMN